MIRIKVKTWRGVPNRLRRCSRKAEGRNTRVSSSLTPAASLFMFQIFKKEKEKPKDLKEVLDCLKKVSEKQEEISSEMEKMKKEAQKSLDRVGVVRFNPFKEIGSDQSFSIAVLDGRKDGFVLTSHYGRDSNRVYAKPIKQGESKYPLSQEEKKAIAKAIEND